MKRLSAHATAAADALSVLSELRTTRERLPTDAPEYPYVADRVLVAAAEAINIGVVPRSVQAVGGFDDLEMVAIRRAAVEFAADDAAVEAEERARSTQRPS